MNCALRTIGGCGLGSLTLLAWLAAGRLAVAETAGRDDARGAPLEAGTIEAIRTMPDAVLKTRPAVKVGGVITFRDPASGLTYLEDEHGGIELRGLPKMDGLDLGRRIEVAGRVDDTRPIPGVIVEEDGLKLREMVRLPPGVPQGAEEIRTGILDGRRVALEATVFRMGFTNGRGDPPWLILNAASSTDHLTWLLPWTPGRPLPRQLLHSKVRCTGVAEAIYNNLGQRIGELLLVASLDDLVVLRPPEADPFDRPTRNLAELLRPGLDDPFERVCIEGVVLCQQQTTVNLIHLRTAQGAIQVEIVEGTFQVGDRLAVVGYPAQASKHVVLRDAVARKLGHEPPPVPLEKSVAELLRFGSDSDLVRIPAVVLRNGLDVSMGHLVIVSSERVVEVLLSSAFNGVERSRLAKELPVGSELELTGVVDLQGNMLATGTVGLTDLRLTLRSPADIVVVRGPPWWTPGRLLALAGGLATVLAMSSAWVFLLRRRVTAQTIIIQDRVERETRWVERSRIARDLHDDVGSTLTQITILSDLGRRVGIEAPQAESQFERISGQAREAVRSLDAIVWTVNPKNDSLSVAVSYFCQMVQDMVRDAGIRCRLEIPDDLPLVPLSAKVRHHLLMAVKEAVHNIIKHSGASVMRLHLESGPEFLRLEIIDNGKGFDATHGPAHRTGQDSMQQRMADVGGTYEITGSAGEGTSVAFVMPWAVLK